MHFLVVVGLVEVVTVYTRWCSTILDVDLCVCLDRKEIECNDRRDKDYYRNNDSSLDLKVAIYTSVQPYDIVRALRVLKPYFMLANFEFTCVQCLMLSSTFLKSAIELIRYDQVLVMIILHLGYLVLYFSRRFELSFA